MFYNIQLEQFVSEDDPLRKIRSLIDTNRIRELCKPLYSDQGRPSVPPEQLFLAWEATRRELRRGLIRRLRSDMAFGGSSV
jgi:hypothetical protein